MKQIFTILLAIAFCKSVNAQTPAIEWQKSFGGIGNDYAFSIIQTFDGGYMVGGSSDSISDDITINHGNSDYWLIKFNNTGTIEWQKSFGGSGYDGVTSVVQTTDSGYIIGGLSDSNDGDVTGNHGNLDYWIVRINNTGIIQWQKSLGGSGPDYCRFNSVIQTSDGGFAVAGGSASHNGNVTGNHGDYDCWIVKLSDTGSIQWQKSFGASNMDQAFSIIQTYDGGYAVAGVTDYIPGNSMYHGGWDYWVLKLTNTGSIEWQKILGGSSVDIAYSIVQTSDSGYVIVGATQSNNVDVTINHGSEDLWLVKLSYNGMLQWQKSLGGSGLDDAISMNKDANGGYILAGVSMSYDFDVVGNHSGTKGDYWVVNTDNSGDLLWQKCLGGSSADRARSVIPTNDGGYAVAGQSSSNDGDVTGNHGSMDAWVVKLAATTGVENIDENIDISLYPNPATNQLFIETKGKAVAEINIYNTNGSLVSQTKQPQGKSIDISSLPNGIYIAEIKTKEASVNRRWVKM